MRRVERARTEGREDRSTVSGWRVILLDVVGEEMGGRRVWRWWRVEEAFLALRVVKIMVRWVVGGWVVRKVVIRRAQMARPRPLVELAC